MGRDITVWLKHRVNCDGTLVLARNMRLSLQSHCPKNELVVIKGVFVFNNEVVVKVTRAT